MDGMSGGRRGCDVVDDPREEAGVVLGGGETHVFQDIHDEFVTVLGQSPQAVQYFVKEPEVVRTGVGITEGLADDGEIVVWE